MFSEDVIPGKRSDEVAKSGSEGQSSLVRRTMDRHAPLCIRIWVVDGHSNALLAGCSHCDEVE